MFSKQRAISPEAWLGRKASQPYCVSLKTLTRCSFLLLFSLFIFPFCTFLRLHLMKVQIIWGEQKELNNELKLSTGKQHLCRTPPPFHSLGIVFYGVFYNFPHFHIMKLPTNSSRRRLSEAGFMPWCSSKHKCQVSSDIKYHHWYNHIILEQGHVLRSLWCKHQSNWWRVLRKVS